MLQIGITGHMMVGNHLWLLLAFPLGGYSLLGIGLILLLSLSWLDISWHWPLVGLVFKDIHVVTLDGILLLPNICLLALYGWGYPQCHQDGIPLQRLGCNGVLTAYFGCCHLCWHFPWLSTLQVMPCVVLVTTVQL